MDGTLAVHEVREPVRPDRPGVVVRRVLPRGREQLRGDVVPVLVDVELAAFEQTAVDVLGDFDVHVRLERDSNPCRPLFHDPLSPSWWEEKSGLPTNTPVLGLMFVLVSVMPLPPALPTF